MRLSSVFQLASLSSPSAGAEHELARPASQAPRLLAAIPGARQPLPDALDERVRLIGEWQLGEPD
jgi:hypothetical protein